MAIYWPPRYNIYANEYKTVFDKMNSRFIIGGDFNAKHTHWGSRLITAKGRELYKAVSDTGCEIVSTGKPTYWLTDPINPDIIGFFVVRTISTNS
jgi:hypothetical protein